MNDGSLVPDYSSDQFPSNRFTYEDDDPSPNGSARRFLWRALLLGLLLMPVQTLLCILPILMALLGGWVKDWRVISSNWTLKAWGIISLTLLITVPFALEPWSAFWGLMNFYPFFLWFGSSQWLVRRPQQLRTIGECLAVSIIPVMILGIGQMFWGWTKQVHLAFPGFTFGFPENLDRMTATFMHANLFANYLAVTFTFTLSLWIEAGNQLRYRWRTLSTRAELWQDLQQNHWFYRWLGLSGSLALHVICLVMANSRNGWAAAALVVLGFAVYCGWRWLIAFGLGIIATTYGAAFASDPLRTVCRWVIPRFVWARLNDELYPDRPQKELRTAQWQFVWEMVQRKPLTGWGMQSFADLYYAYSQIRLNHPHNLFFLLAFSTGLINACLFVGLVGILMGRSVYVLVKRWLAPLERQWLFTTIMAFICCIVFHITDSSMFDPRLNCLGWLLLGSLSGVTEQILNYHKQSQILND
ncbi:MAG: O-antigen ligase family protein [Pseudanabaenaceae cyanobacterium]